MRATGWGGWFAILVTAAAATPACAGPAPNATAPTAPMADAVAHGHKQLRLLPAAKPAPAPAPRAQVAIIIDDLGEQQLGGLHALALPGPVALAFLPKAR